MLPQNKTLRFVTILTALACLAGLSAACGAGGNRADDGDARANRMQQQIRVQQSAPEQDGERSLATEQRLEQIAEGIREVQHANCVIFGNTAIVGIDVGGELDRSRVGTIKYAVAEALKKDPVGINAIVTADMDLNHRLQEIRTDMENGRPIEGFAEELADIVGRIIPQLPMDTVEPESPPPDPAATTQEQGEQKAKSGMSP